MRSSVRSREWRGWPWAGEALRWALLAATAVYVTRPLWTGLFVGGTDARWYAEMLQDFLRQFRSGRFPVLVGQGPGAWNGGIHPFRSAPMFFYWAAFWDLVTFRSLGLYALQHLTAIGSAAMGCAGFYAAAVALLPRRRWAALVLAVLYVSAPAWLAILYRADAYMTFMALGVLPLALYGNARALLSSDGRGYVALGAGLALLWMCHPPVALLSCFATALLQGGRLLLGDPTRAQWKGAAKGCLFFVGGAAFYFAGMSGLPPVPGSPRQDAVRLLGAGLILAALARGGLRRSGWRWAGAWLCGAVILWFSSPPWFWWLAVATVLCLGSAEAGRRLLGFCPARRAGEILFLSLLVAAGLVQAGLGPNAPGRDGAALLGLYANQAHWPDFFLPVDALHTGSDYQPGIGLWLIFAVLAWAFFRTRSGAVKLLFSAAFLAFIGLVQIPGVSEFLVGYQPSCLAHIGNYPLVLRLVPTLSGFLAMAGIVLLARQPAGTWRRAGPLVILGAAGIWGLRQDSALIDAGARLRATAQHSRDLLRPENVVMVHFNYDLLPIPTYYWEGALDPQLQIRLLDPANRPLTGPDETAGVMETEGSRTLHLVAHHVPGEGPEWLEVTPGFTLQPGEHVLLRFQFDLSRDYSGWLILESEHDYRENHLPDAGGLDGFGVAPQRSHVMSLWNSGSQPEHFRFRMTREGSNNVGDGSFVADLVLSHFDPARMPVRLESLDPLRFRVSTARPAWVETPRVFLPGYRATIDGRPAPVGQSREKLAMVAVPAGQHEVQVTYRGTWELMLAGLISLGTWAAGLSALWRRATRRPAASGEMPEPERDEDPADHEAVLRFKRTIGRVLVVAAVAAVLGFYIWTVRTSGASFLQVNARNEYYNELVRGFRAGHLYMDAPVDPRLLALPPDKLPGSASYLLDASFYRGHYYLYFGVTPAVLLFWPYACLTGQALPEAAAALILAMAAFALAAGWWLRIRRTFFPGLGLAWTALAILAIGIGSAAPSALRRPMFYEVAIFSGYAFSMAALWACTEAILQPARRWRWLAAAGAAVGLAAGSRPNLLPAGLILLVLAAVKSETAPGRRRWLAMGGLAAALAGVGPVLAGLAGYNLARFGNPFEFGHRYQLGTNPRHLFHFANLVDNLRIYYLTPPALNGYFPFVAPALAPPPPADYIGREHVHGEWIWLPLLALALATAILSWRSRRPRAGWILGGLLMLFLVNLTLVGAIGSRANRYFLDFHPSLVLAILTCLAPALIGRGWWKSAARAGAGIGLAAVLVFNALASMEVHGFFALASPAAFNRMADWANRLVWPWLRGESDAVGDRLVSLVWPATAGGAGPWSPILVAGTPGFEDVLWSHWDGIGHVQFAYQHGEYGVAPGPWFPIPAGPATVRIGGAFLLPGLGHPWYGALPPEEQLVLKRRLRITVDGVVRYDRDVPSFDSSPRLQHWGSYRAPDTTETFRFSGRIGRPSDLAPDLQAAREDLEATGAVRLAVLLPSDRFGSVEPLLQSGPADAFDTLSVQYVDPKTVRLVHDNLGSGVEESAPFPVDYSRLQEVEIRGPFASDGIDWSGANPAPDRNPPKRLVVRWNGRDVFACSFLPHPASPGSLAAGGSLRHSSTARLMFGGMLVEIPRLEPLGPVGPGMLRLSRPSADFFADADRGVLLRLDRQDGESAAVIWEKAGEGVKFGWTDAEGTQWTQPWKPSGASEISLAISAPQTSRDVGVSGAGVAAFEDLELRGNGRLLLTASTDLLSQGESTAVGIGSGNWSGSALDRLSSHLPPPAPAAGLPGRIRIRFRLPPAFAGGQPLLEAGRPGAADSIFVRHGSAGSFVFGLDHWGIGEAVSEPVRISPASSHSLLVELGSLIQGAAGAEHDRARLVLDGRTILDVSLPLYSVRPGEVFIGENPLGMSTSDPAFGGEIISVRVRQAQPGAGR